MRLNSLSHILLIAAALSGCATTTATHSPGDPFEAANRSIFKFNEAADKVITKPLAKGYDTVMPIPGKVIVNNFFSNLDDVVVTINDLMQFKLAQAYSDGGRVLINSTIGVLGLIDIATVTGLEKHNEDFGQTLGRWGLGSGPYLMLPLIGPSTVRDSFGLAIDSQLSALRPIRPVRQRNQLYATKVIHRRAQLFDQEKFLDEIAIDRYLFVRDAYLTRREHLVYDGHPPKSAEEDGEDDFDDTPVSPLPVTPDAPPPATEPETSSSGSSPPETPATP